MAPRIGYKIADCSAGIWMSHTLCTQTCIFWAS